MCSRGWRGSDCCRSRRWRGGGETTAELWPGESRVAVGGLAGLEVRGWRLSRRPEEPPILRHGELVFFVLGGDGFKSALSPLVTTLDFM
jgi:hypothetical protein